MKNLPEGKTQLVMKCMEKLDEWDFDVWTLQDMTEQGSIFYAAYAMFLRWDLFRRLEIDEQIAINFFSQVEAGYHPNAYHNSMHGADVMHIVHYILLKGQGKEKLQLKDHDVLAMLVAAMIHDFDHPGLNNNFHIKVQSYLSTLYNDRSVLENHHLAEVFDLMKTPRFNLFHCLKPEHALDARETMIEVVLATDMGLHAKVFGAWKRRLAQNHTLHKRKDDQRLALSMCIKMADISNCGRPLDMYLKWSTKLVEEFFAQGDNERARGDTVSPFMDRQQPHMGKGQVAFMNYVILPMFESIGEYLPEMMFAVDIALTNKAYWKQVE
jgi:3',5'-cyclic-nucleotide phosphodiesterase